MQHDLEGKIRERAHRLWEEEGRPEGRSEEHWREAERQVMAEEGLGEPAVGAQPDLSERNRPEPQPEVPSGSTGGAGKAAASSRSTGEKAVESDKAGASTGASGGAVPPSPSNGGAGRVEESRASDTGSAEKPATRRATTSSRSRAKTAP